MRDEDFLRARMRQLVDDVEPRSDALPTLLATVRRRRSSYVPPRRVIAAASVAVGATAVFLVALLAFPGQPHHAQPVSVRPNSYVAEPEPGVLAFFDVASGRQIGNLARVSQEHTGMRAPDGDRIYTTVIKETGRDLVEITTSGTVHPVRTSVPGDILAAEAGRIAYVAEDAIVILDGARERRVPIPPAVRVLDMAMDPGGRLAVLSRPEAGGPTVLRVVETNARSAVDSAPLRTAAPCGPLAITFSGPEVAALLPSDCGSGLVRVATLDGRTGEQIGAGAPFDIGARRPGSALELSADRLGRFLLSTGDSRQWVVDGAEVQRVPPACTDRGSCSRTPGVFWD